MDYHPSETELGSVTLVRHGQSEANRLNILQGQLDYPLDEIGIEQANLLAKFWTTSQPSFDIFICSPLARALQTAVILSKVIEAPLEMDEIWMERHMGVAQGQPISDFSEFSGGGSYPTPFEPNFESGESNWDLHRRAGEALASLINRFPARILVVSHGAIMNAVIRCALGLSPAVGHRRPTSFRFKNTGLSKLEYSIPEGIWWVRAYNHLPHLQEH